MHILGIETSCDETSVAVIDGAGAVKANLIFSQIARHQPFGGVVPEIASREHLEHLMPLLDRALTDTGVNLGDIDAIAVTSGPGLIGALLVGVSAAQGLSYGLDVPLVAVNHLEGHIFSPYLRLEGESVPLPRRFFAVVVSGGHSSIYEVITQPELRITMLNRTRDDAAGEVFDKVAKFVGLPYPGGPHVERIARGGDAGHYRFSLPQTKDDSHDFSFSGLKAAAIRLAREEGLAGRPEEELADFCASFQKAICDQIIDRLERIWSAGAEAPEEVALAGGVAANGPLRERIASWAESRGVTVRLPERRYCTDNAAMIAFAGLQRARARGYDDPLRVEARSRMPVGA
jgi:N6-L-threonylcarbamoyladenine synthase